LIREGTPLDEELTTRPIVGVSWTVDTAVIYHKQRHPKTVPILVKKLKKQLNIDVKEPGSLAVAVPASMKIPKRPPQAAANGPTQLMLLRETQ